MHGSSNMFTLRKCKLFIDLYERQYLELFHKNQVKLTNRKGESVAVTKMTITFGVAQHHIHSDELRWHYGEIPISRLVNFLNRIQIDEIFLVS